MLDEVCGIIARCAQRGGVVQQTDHGIRTRLGGEPGQCALARLPGTIQRDDPGIGQRFGDEVSGVARHQVQILVHHSIIHGQMISVVIWPVVPWSSGRYVRGRLAASRVVIQPNGHLRRTADVRFLEPPMDLPPITEMLWWNPRRTMDPAHAWLRARIAEIAAELDQADPAA